MVVALLVDLVDHRRERRGLAAARGPVTNTRPARPFGERRQDLRKTELLEAADLFESAGRPRRPHHAWLKNVATRKRDPMALIPNEKIQLHRLLEALLLRVGEHAVHELLGVRRLKVGHVEPLEMSVHRTCGGVLVAMCRSDPSMSTFAVFNSSGSTSAQPCFVQSLLDRFPDDFFESR